jgi:hypothetical protein
MAVFRQSTSRADDPQLHTHVVISAKVQTADGCWRALDAKGLKKYQQAFGYLYQSVLRAEISRRFGVVFEPVVNGQAEIAGLPEPPLADDARLEPSEIVRRRLRNAAPCLIQYGGETVTSQALPDLRWTRPEPTRSMTRTPRSGTSKAGLRDTRLGP